MTQVVHIKTKRFDINIGRTSWNHTNPGDGWGNPFSWKPSSLAHWIVPKEQVLMKYWEWLWDAKNRNLRERMVKQLDGKVLGCWCAPHPCHGNLIVFTIEIMKETDPDKKLELIRKAVDWIEEKSREVK